MAMVSQLLVDTVAMFLLSLVHNVSNFNVTCRYSCYSFAVIFSCNGNNFDFTCTTIGSDFTVTYKYSGILERTVAYKSLYGNCLIIKDTMI